MAKLVAGFLQWWRKRKKGVRLVMIYDEREIADVFNRLGGCCGCTHWKHDMVLARICRFYLDSLDGKSPTPPTLEDLAKHCCKNEGKFGRTITVDTSRIAGGRILPGEPLPP
jgi:hypothetical protein